MKKIIFHDISFIRILFLSLRANCGRSFFARNRNNLIDKTMYSNAHGGVTVYTFFDTRRPVEGAKYPVKVRVRYKRERRDYPTGKKLTVDEWKKLPSTKEREISQVRKEINSSFKVVDDIIEELNRADMFSFDALNLRLSKGTRGAVNMAFKAKINRLEEYGQAGTQLYYNTALNSIAAFGGEKIKFSDITPEWLRRYQGHLLDEGKSYATIGMYMRAIRAIINEAKADGLISEAQYPFGKNKYQIRTGEGRKLALTMQQIKAVVTFSDGSETTERYRDLWFFSYLTNGINFSDILRLRYSNIVGDEIYFYRQKTIRTSKVKKEIQAIITPQMQSIIDRWGNPVREPESFIFPYLTGDENPMQAKKKIADIIRRANRRLKIIGAAVGIEGLSTYSARHSFATVLKRSGANISFISESLGHGDLKTTESYMASFEKDERRKNAALLTKFE